MAPPRPEPGTAASVTLRVIENESTAVNLFLASELDAVNAVGPDRQRLAGKYEEITGLGTVGEVLFNQSGSACRLSRSVARSAVAGVRWVTPTTSAAVRCVTGQRRVPPSRARLA